MRKALLDGAFHFLGSKLHRLDRLVCAHMRPISTADQSVHPSPGADFDKEVERQITRHEHRLTASGEWTLLGRGSKV